MMMIVFADEGPDAIDLVHSISNNDGPDNCDDDNNVAGGERTHQNNVGGDSADGNANEGECHHHNDDGGNSNEN